MPQRQSNKHESYRRQIDFVFYHEPELREKIFMLRNGKIIGAFKSAQTSKTADPTVSTAVRNLTPLQTAVVAGRILHLPESWLSVVDKTYDWSRQFKDCRYEIARRRYTGEDYRQTCLDLHISNSTRRRLFELFQFHAAIQAAGLGLISV